MLAMISRGATNNLATQDHVGFSPLSLPPETSKTEIMSWLIILWLLGFFDSGGDD